jgi:hypothetical protein
MTIEEYANRMSDKKYLRIFRKNNQGKWPWLFSLLKKRKSTTKIKLNMLKCIRRIVYG